MKQRNLLGRESKLEKFSKEMQHEFCKIPNEMCKLKNER